MKQKIKKKVFVFQITGFELGVANSGNIQQDICHRQAMCQQIHLRFHLTLGETFCKSTCLKIMKKHDKCAVREILQVFGTHSHVDVKSVF